MLVVDFVSFLPLGCLHLNQIGTVCHSEFFKRDSQSVFSNFHYLLDGTCNFCPTDTVNVYRYFSCLSQVQTGLRLRREPTDRVFETRITVRSRYKRKREVLTPILRIENDRDRSIIGEGDFHVGPEFARLNGLA